MRLRSQPSTIRRKTLADIAAEYGLTRQRISQILKERDIDFRIVLLRRRNREKAYKEALRAAKAQRATVLPGGKRRPEYTVHRNMLNRCSNANCRGYKHYPGRGIAVCEQWLGRFGFEKFLSDMGPGPEAQYANGRAKYSIHRIDNDGDYDPDNCKWATQAEQCANRRNRQHKAGQL